MKQRITYLLPEGASVDPADVKVTSESLEFSRASDGAEEWLLTLGLNDLPEEVRTVLEECHELHIRWVSPSNRGFLSPLVSRLPSGLHVFFTPRKGSQDVQLCGLLQKFSARKLKCHSVAETLSRPAILSERFATSSTYQYYQLLNSVEQIGTIFLRKLCQPGTGLFDTDRPALDSCESRLLELESAAYIDVDFDAVTHVIHFTAFWDDFSTDLTRVRRASRPIVEPRAEDRIEVGIFESRKATELEELALGGYLTLVGEEDHPKATQFSFPSRHHPLPASSRTSFRTSFQNPTGLHPKLSITLPNRSLAPPKDSCALHAYWTLPSTVFIDRYQLSDPLFLASQNLISLRSLSGEEDLEAPEWVIKRWGSAALFELATPSSRQSEQSSQPANWTITIPTHLRYVDGRHSDSSASDHATVHVPWPVLFWACEAEEGLKMTTNPFDRFNIGYDGLFGPKTMFYHIPPAADVRTTVEAIEIPILNADKAQWVRIGTLVVVVAGFAWVCWKLLRSAGGSGAIIQDSKRKRT